MISHLPRRLYSTGFSDKKNTYRSLVPAIHLTNLSLVDYLTVFLVDGFCLASNDETYKVFTAVTMKNAVFWDVTQCGSCKNRYFGGT
jgi:hypothetical protein